MYLKLFFLFAFFITSIPVAAQNSPSHRDGNVYLTVTVTDGNSYSITGLVQDQFMVLEKKLPLKISYFEPFDRPVSMAFVVDLSSSLREDFKKLAIDLTIQMMRSGHPQNEYIIVFVNRKARLVSDWSSNVNEITTVLEKAAKEKQGGQTALFDGCDLALKKFESSKHLKRVMVLFTDGGDGVSKISFDQLRDALKRSAVTSYAIAGMGAEMAGSSFGYESTTHLEELCDTSGGKAYFPRSSLEMRDIVELIAYQLRRQYVIGFEPPLRDNKMHSITVKVLPLKTPAKTTRIFVFHRKAYYSQQL